MKRSGQQGFTLIELLTVIAIIAILAAITFIAAPRLIERAKLRALNSTMLDLRTQLAQYYVDHGTYPPRYGYVDAPAFRQWQERRNANPSEPAPPDNVLHNLRPFLAFLGHHGNEDYHDNFSEGYDADRDGQISALEYSPIGLYNAATDRYAFDNTTLYDGLTPDVEVNRMRNEDRARRPLIYVPVNLRQFNRVREYWINNQAFYGEIYDPAEIQGMMTFPPNYYDAFVLISVGPGGSTFGVAPLTTAPDYLDVINRFERFKYHILGLRTFFLATRDLNNNNVPDFHYDARRTGEAAVGDYNVPGTNFTANNDLPYPRAPKGYGPFIFAYP